MSPKRDPEPGEPEPRADLFGLSEVVEYRVNPEADPIFDDCEALVKAFAAEDRVIKQRYLDEDPIELPVYKQDKEHRYQLKRTVDPSGVTYTYQRLGLGYERAGFRLSRMHLSPTVLSAFDAEGIPVEDPEIITKMIVEAKEQIRAYAKACGVHPTELSQYKELEIVPESRKRRVAQGILRVLAWPFTAPYYSDKKGEMYRSKLFTEGRRVERMAGFRHASLPRLALVAMLVPAPSPSSDVSLGTISLRKPAAIEVVDDIVNRGEHKRQGFDAQGLEIPLSSGIVVAQQANIVLEETPPLPTELAHRLTDAPTLNARSGSRQDLYGGPRRLRNLGTDSSITDDTSDLDKNQCADIKVNMAGGDRLLVANIGPNISKLISFQLLRNKIVICNVSGGSISEDYLSSMYVQVIQPGK